MGLDELDQVLLGRKVLWGASYEGGRNVLGGHTCEGVLVLVAGGEEYWDLEKNWKENTCFLHIQTDMMKRQWNIFTKHKMVCSGVHLMFCLNLKLCIAPTQLECDC